MRKEEKLTLEKELAKRPIKLASNTVWTLYQLLAISPFFSRKYHPTYEIIDNPKDCKTGCFVIWNHLSRRDYMFLKTLLHPRKFSMVAGYTEFFRSHLAPLFKLARIIPKKPFYNGDMSAVMAMARIIKHGGIVTFSPEGTSSVFGDNQPITPGTGAFIKKIGVPVYMVDYRGHYLSSNKVDIKDKCGKVYLKMYKLFTPEDLKEKSAEEINAIINEKFRHDEYLWNLEKQIRYKGKGYMASHLDDMCYKCPKCGKEFTMVAKGDEMICSECGNGLRLDEKYNMIPLSADCVLPKTPSKWAQWERHNIIQEIRRDKDYSFKRHFKIGGLPKYKTLKHHRLNEIQGEGDFIIDHSGVHIIGTRENKPYEMHLSYKELYCPCVEDDLQTLTFYPNGKSTDIIIDDKSGGKIYMLIQEMHRLHENYWKNFPWFDYMYEDIEKDIDFEIYK
ncbi:MAG: 1-acyl-sn-glycerol-3-phosphate acyltransferase [Erysipelotrichaceae bacterium]|nr:1-acyl-sn-glycerol-3-phosphate acyltransferase [Erysipelotrichaceae bacterium]